MRYRQNDKMIALLKIFNENDFELIFIKLNQFESIFVK